MHQNAVDVAEYISFLPIVVGCYLILSTGFGSRYRSAGEIPKTTLLRVAAIIVPLMFITVLTQIFRNSISWLTYVPLPWVYPA